MRWQILVLEELLREAKISALGLAGTHPTLRSVILTLRNSCPQLSPSQLRRNHFFKANAERQGLRNPSARMQQPRATTTELRLPSAIHLLTCVLSKALSLGKGRFPPASSFLCRNLPKEVPVDTRLNLGLCFEKTYQSLS